MDETTEWRPIPGLELRYEVSEHGDVRNLRTGIVRKHKITTHSKHHYVVLDHTYYAIHRLVARVFLGESELPVVRHLDDDRANNHWRNLAWGTQHENVLDAVRNGVHQQAKKTHCPHGHEFTPENTRFRPSSNPKWNGSRICRACEAKYAHGRVA